MAKLLSIIIPAFNEERTITEVLDIVCNLKLSNGYSQEVIVINDQSSDSTQELIEKFIATHSGCSIMLHNCTVNEGKGAALQLGIKLAKGEFLIPQDADMELNPNEIDLLLNHAIKNDLNVVYGSRFLGERHSKKNASYYANQLLTFLSNRLTRLPTTDMETCYKLIKSDLAKSITLKEKRFGFEPEITAKLAKNKAVKYGEIPITYKVRTYEEGKKIGWKDGVKALYCVFKYSI